MRRSVGTAVLLCGLLTGCAGPAPDTQSPPAPLELTAQAGSSGSVHVMWAEADPADGVTGYQVFRGAALVRELPADKRMVDITGLTPGPRTPSPYGPRTPRATSRRAAPRRA